MKSIKWLPVALGFVFLVNASVVFAAKDNHDLKPRHGGVMSEASHKEFELVLKPEGIQLYALDHGTPMDLSKASASITILDGSDLIERTLTAQPQLLKGEGVVLKNSHYTAIATVEFGNKKKTTVRFSNKSSK